jgi:L-2,4-diaminobutyric acid acetyltransferase
MEDSADDLEIGRPTIDDGLALWETAQAAGGLDVNPPYAYVLWARDFAETTAVVRDRGRVVAYCTGFRRPDEPSTLFVWQVAVRPEARRRGLGQRMLHHLVDRDDGIDAMEATVTADNAASLAMFGRFAEQRGATTEVSPLFTRAHLGPDHDPEDLVRIPLR